MQRMRLNRTAGAGVGGAMSLSSPRAAGVLLAWTLGNVALGQSFLLDHQEKDGHWSAVTGGGKPEAELRVNAWIALAMLGDDWTARANAQQKPVLAVVDWLCAQQDPVGRLLPRADGDWLLDHAIATFALAEAQRLAPAEARAGHLADAVTALIWGFSKAPANSPGEVQLWGFLVAKSLRMGRDSAARASADRLDAARVLLPATPAATDRERAALDLLADLDTEQRPTDDALPQHWPASLLADPLHTFYATATAFGRGGACWNRAQRMVNGLVHVQHQGDPAAVKGSWDPEGAFGTTNGRFGTSACAMLCLELYYRYCKLVLFK